MKTKEEILEQHLTVETRGSDLIRGSSYNFTYAHPSNALLAMDEFAKQQSVEFATYLGKIMSGAVSVRIKPGETLEWPDIYDKFIEHQSLNK